MALNIMIVDDSSVMRTFIRKVVALTGLDVGGCYEAGNGEDALHALGEKWIDLILTDINMPTMNGEEFLRQVQANELFRTIPVIVVSTDSSRSRVQQMLALGARGYVSKPFHPEELRDQVERILGQPNDESRV